MSAWAAFAAVGFLVSCDQPEPVTYTIPKEDRSEGGAMPTAADAPEAGGPAPAATDSSKMQVLPGMAEAAAAAPELSYEVPENWEEFSPQSIRKANFRVSDESGRAEITVTTFPGDVGGLLANINRWRNQIGLDAVQEPELDEMTQAITISNHGATLVTLPGPEQSVLGGILDFHGNTWFFKMQGATGTVVAETDSFQTFLSSVRIEDHHH